MNDILKGEMGFQGFTVSDWEDVERLYTRDKVADSPEEAVRLAVMNGLDMSMVPYSFSFYDHCVNLGKKDAKFLERVNDATMRILKAKDALGLFENALPVAADLSNIGTADSEAFNLEAARESIILAKNERNTLPLATNRRILVTGPTGNIIRSMNGGWTYTWQGNNEPYYRLFGRAKTSVYDAIRNYAPSTYFVEGVNFTDVIDINSAVVQAQLVDVIVLCLGEDTYTETPGIINSLEISDSQIKLAEALLPLGKPIVIVYLGGRPRVMTDIGAQVDAVLLGFLPGMQGGVAIADILFGTTNPSGKLPITYPKYPNGITTYDHLPLETFDVNRYEYLFPFGHGLSYTQFTYSNLRLSTDALVYPNELKVQVTVQNTGGRDGKEAVLLYLNDEFGDVPRPSRQLKKFTKINLKSGESKTVEFTLTEYDLSFINKKSKRVCENGKFNIYVADKTASFTLSGVKEDSKNFSVSSFPIINTLVAVFSLFAAFILKF
jgi:beta-glucosidase